MQDLARQCIILEDIFQESSKNRFILKSLFQDFKVSYKIHVRIALNSQCFFNEQNVSDTFQVLCFPLQKCSKNLTVDSEPSVLRRFTKRQE